MARVWFLALFLNIIFLSEFQCAKILAVFPTPAISHQVVFRPYIHELVKRGHEVVLVTPDPAFPKGQAPANLTEIDVHDMSYAHWEELLSLHDGKKESILKQATKIFEKITSVFEIQLQTPEFQRIIKEEKDTFDLIVLEAFYRSALGLGHLLKKPIIQFNSFGAASIHFDQFGAPSHPIIYPTAANQRLYNLSMLEKLWEFFKYFMVECLLIFTYNYDFDMAKRNFGEDIPSFEVLHDKYVHMLILNEHQIWAENHPIPPNILFVGGIHQAPDKALPSDLQEYLDSSKNGVIYISFGTSVRTKTLSVETVKLMAKVFSELPYDVLWKWDEDELPGRSSNVKISKWLPQAQLLKHPNIKLFVTQGGLQSTTETINAAVPVIGIPMLGDQWYNTEKYGYHKIGLQLDIHSLTEETFKEAITTVIENKSYKENILRLRTLMQDHPIKPLDLAIWWTEYILRNGGKHLRSPAASVPWTTYYELPLVFTILLILCILILLFILKSQALLSGVAYAPLRNSLNPFCRVLLLMYISLSPLKWRQILLDVSCRKKTSF
ncbi:UDP-glucosyltransferase 2-like [Zerene cesonia]|uniref:UDP-glucosyltransferase 2-like n=1 Tax=Zerene cesonia TaxID=33412 RepID=UPI0018E51710|nr:UDP-glucosyltransferase 2-like [Zerene cesonia]